MEINFSQLFRIVRFKVVQKQNFGLLFQVPYSQKNKVMFIRGVSKQTTTPFYFINFLSLQTHIFHQTIIGSSCPLLVPRKKNSDVNHK